MASGRLSPVARPRPAGRRRLPRLTRSLAITRVQRQLIEQSFPRLQMMLIVLLTGGCGLLSSFVLLHLGVHGMALRYPLALALAYGGFLLLIGLWLRVRADEMTDVPDLVQAGPDVLPDIAVDLPHALPDALPALVSGGGGDFAGAGASASFDAPVGLVKQAGEASGEAVGKAVGAVADADELAIPLLLLALALGLALASLYVVYIAPMLFAEVLVDGALSVALYRHLKGQEPRHWLVGTLRRTALPFAATAVLLALLGAALTAQAPGAHSLGQVLQRQAAAPAAASAP